MFYLKFTHLEYNSVDMGKALESLWKRLRSLTSLFGWISLLGIWQPWRTSLFHLWRGHPCGMIVSMWASREPLASSVCGRALERCRGCWVLRRVPSPAKVALGQTLGEHLQVLLQVHLQVLLQHTKCSTTGQWWMSVLMEVSSWGDSTHCSWTDFYLVTAPWKMCPMAMAEKSWNTFLVPGGWASFWPPFSWSHWPALLRARGASATSSRTCSGRLWGRLAPNVKYS